MIRNSTFESSGVLDRYWSRRYLSRARLMILSSISANLLSTFLITRIDESSNPKLKMLTHHLKPSVTFITYSMS